jgi:S1-C subfamily serine protease
MQITMKQTALDDAHPASDRAWRDSQPGLSKPRVRRRRSRLPGWLAILGFFAPVTACFAASSLLSPENRRDLELQPGVVLILVQYKATLGAFSCSPGVLGSGFLYRPDGYLITNGHVAQLANEKDHKADIQRMITAEPLLRQAALESVAKQLGRDLTDPEKQVVVDQVDKLIAGGQMRVEDVKLTVILDNGTSHQGEIKAYSDPINENGKDVAIIKIDARNVPTVALGNSDDVSVGDSLTVVGYPGEATNATLGGLFSERSLLIPTVTNGRISAVNKTDYKGTPVLQSEAVINHGNSGGPAFDDQGRVVGIATYTLNKTEGSVAGLNFFVPINTAMEFVRQAGADPQRGPFDRTWHDALEAYAGQHWYKAHELMGSVLEEMPNQPDAMKLQLQSAQNIRNLNPVQYWIDRLGIGEFAVLATVLVLVLFVAVLLLVRKPGTKPVVASAPLQRAAEPLPATVASVQTVNAVLPGIESFGSLYVSNGPLSGNRFQIPKKGLLIGRDAAQCGLVLPDDNVSKEHAWVVPLDNGVAVIDRSSTNGTYVNSADSPRINKMLLKNGDRIFIGRKNPTEITYFSS